MHLPRPTLSLLACTITVLALLGHAHAGPSSDLQTDSERHVWISLGADALAALDQQGMTSVLTSAVKPVHVTDDVAAMRVRADDLEVVSSLIHSELHRCGGFMVHESYDEAIAAVLASELATSERAFPLAAMVIDNQEVVQELLPQLAASNLVDTINLLSSFPNRFYQSSSGVQAAQSLADRWTTYAAGRTDVTVELIAHAEYAQPSVAMTILGTTEPDAVVVVGGHLDSIAFSGGGQMVAPGADDNASGIAVITELARVLLSSGYRPDRTIKLYGYAAEEVGLRGSTDIAQQARADGLNVIGVMQLDMVNYNGSNADMALVRDNTDPALTDFVASLASAYVGATVVDDTCGYACSDHASWHRENFPALLPFESRISESNPVIHSSQDTLANSGGGADHALKFAMLATAFVAEMADGALPSPEPPVEPPPIDDPDPLPNDDDPIADPPIDDQAVSGGCHAAPASPLGGVGLALAAMLALAWVRRRA